MPPQQQQGRRPKKKSQYGLQLEEKQNLKKTYGIREEQLRVYYTHAKKSREETGPSMISLLERRLDNAIFRVGFAETRRQARQMSSHRFFEVNGRPVNVPSYRLRKGDMITIRESKRDKKYFANLEKKMQNAQLPEWLEVDIEAYGFKILNHPTAEEANTGVHIQSVVELLSR